MTDDQSTDGTNQSALFAEQMITETETVPSTVWIVASRKEDSPHPYVEAVYDNEDAAREHEKELTNHSFQHGVVAWRVFERSVEPDAGKEASGR